MERSFLTLKKYISKYQSPLAAVLVASGLAACGDDPGPRRVRAPEPVLSAVDINSASVEDLDRLPGIGPATAARIVAHRQEFGRFRRPEHLMLVDGVSEKRYRALRGLVTVR